jgi:integrase
LVSPKGDAEMKNGARKKLTDITIQNLKPGPKRFIEWEPHGLGVRVTPKGVKSFVFVYRYEGRLRMMTLRNEAGKTTYPSISLAEARKAHRDALDKLNGGVDPAAMADAEREEHRSAPTVADLAGEYLEKWAKPRKRSWREDARILTKDVLPVWGQRKAKDITRRDVIRLLDGVVDRGAGIMANRTLAVIRKMFNFAVTRDMVPVSPCIGARAPAPEKSRDRVLTPDEIRALWQGLEAAKMAEGTKLALKLQLVTAQRKGEVVSAAWEELDLAESWWTIPGHKSKNGLPHRVPLSPLAIELFQAAKAYSGDSPWIFPSPRGNKHITPEAVDHAIRRPGLEALGSTFVPHDLRRTAASNIASLGFGAFVGKVLNHKERGVTAVYDRHSYDQEKRQALEAWGRKLTTIIFGSDDNENKVVLLSRGA